MLRLSLKCASNGAYQTYDIILRTELKKKQK